MKILMKTAKFRSKESNDKQGTWTMKNILMITLCTAALPFSVNAQETNNEIQYRKISMEEYRAKVAGGWLGQAIGVLHGQWTEGKWQGEIVPFDLEDWYMLDPEIKKRAEAIIDLKGIKDLPEKRAVYHSLGINDKENWKKWTPHMMPDQDDLYVEFMFLYSIRKHGLDVTDRQIAEDWSRIFLKEKMAGANGEAFKMFRRGLFPPWADYPPDHTEVSKYLRGWARPAAIDFQIESDLFGLISPGMPRVSNAWCDKVGHIMNHGDGVYGGMAMAAMYSEAFFECDPKKLVEYSLRAIPAESNYAKMIRDVIELHQKYPDWQDAWKELEEKWVQPERRLASGLDVIINGAYIYMGLLYGEGDLWKTMNISMRCGRDSDCNPSSAAGILGTALGMKGIPEKWAILRDLPISNWRIDTNAIPRKMDWDYIIERTVEVGKSNVLKNGGYADDGILNIPHMAPVSPPLEQPPL